MKKGLFAVMALLIVFAIIGCDTGSSPGANRVPEGKIRITFNLGGAPGTPPPYIDLDKGTAITAEQIPADPGWAGHTFDGWYNGAVRLVAGLSWQNNIVFTARWTAGQGGAGLSPWKPDTNPPAPGAGYKNFYDSEDPEDWKYSTFAGSGNVGVIEANGDGTYTVSIKTVPGGRSIISFNSLSYMFKNGYYMLFDFPENAEAKPIAAVTLAATGSTNEEGQIWGTEYNVNTVTGWVPIRDNVYLAGEIAFARDDLADLNTLYKSVLLNLVWSEDEEAEIYEFTLKKLLITTGEDLTPPDPNALEKWEPDPKDEPADYIAFPQGEDLRATFYPWSPDNGIAGNTVTVAAPATGRSLVRLLGTDYKWAKGYYLSITLPEDSNKPSKIYSLGTEKDDSDGQWGVADVVTAPEGKFITGRVDFVWASDESTDGYTGIMLDIYWHPEQTETMYTFTINKILVAGEYDGSIPPPPAEVPEMHDLSKFDDTEYDVDDPADPIIFVPKWAAHWAEYEYNWYYKEGPISEPPDPAVFDYYKWGGDGNALDLGGDYADVQGKYIIPPTDAAGTFYYYVVVSYGEAKTTSPIVKIVVK